MKKQLVLVMVLAMVSVASATSNFSETYGTDAGRVGLASRWTPGSASPSGSPAITITDELSRSVIGATAGGGTAQIEINQTALPSATTPTWGLGELTMNVGLDIIVTDMDQMRIILINKEGRLDGSGNTIGSLMWQKIIVWSSMLDNGVGEHTVSFVGNPLGQLGLLETQMEIFIDGNSTGFLPSQNENDVWPGLYVRGYNATGTARDLYAITDVSFNQIPEPMTMSLLGLGGLALIRRRRKA